MKAGRFSLTLKLSLAFIVLTLLAASVGYYETNSLRNINHSYSDLLNEDIQRTELLHQLVTDGDQLKDDTLHTINLSKPAAATITTAKDNVNTQNKALLDKINRYAQLNPDDRQVLSTLTTEVNQLKDRATIALDSTNKTTVLLASKTADLENANAEFTHTLQVTLDKENKHIADQRLAISQQLTRLMQITIVAVAVGGLLALVVGFWFALSLAHGLRKLQIGAGRIANGDFSRQVSVSSNDEVGTLAKTFNEMATRLRDSYQRLTLETERDKILLESLGEGVVAIDAKTNIVLINDEAIQLLELPVRDKLIGIPFNHVLTLYDDHEKALVGAETPVVQSLKLSRAVSGVYGLHRKNGAKLKIAVGANPVMVNGKLSGVIMNLRDVTKEKEVDRMKTEFISLASHQLRTPLSAIRWFSEMLLSGDAGKLQPEQIEFASNIADSTERMISLVNSLLNISRIESGRIIVDPKPTDLRELVSGIINDLRAKIDERKQNLVVSVHKDLPMINIDPRLIGQVYLNLLTNAIKYTQKGGEISVFISKNDTDVITQVTDNGYGIPKEEQSRLFEKFFRATNAVKVETDGTGLGLYLIKAIIESSGGKIWFESEVGKGTTFWFTIPLQGMKPKKGEVTLDS